MRRRSRPLAGAGAGLAVLAAGLLVAPPASAAPRLQVSPATGVPRSGGTVTVTGAGYAAEGVGVYVGWCKVVPQYWTSADNCADARWVHAGGAGAGQVPLSPAGTFTATLSVTPRIGSTSCLDPGACTVLTMAAHGSSDRSQDAFAAVTFATPTPHSAQRRADTPPARSPTTSSAPRPDRTATRHSDPVAPRIRGTDAAPTPVSIPVSTAVAIPVSTPAGAAAGPSSAVPSASRPATLAPVAGARSASEGVAVGRFAVLGAAVVLVAAATVFVLRRRSARSGE